MEGAGRSKEVSSRGGLDWKVRCHGLMDGVKGQVRTRRDVIPEVYSEGETELGMKDTRK